MKKIGLRKDAGRSWIEVGGEVYNFVVGDELLPESVEIREMWRRLEEKITAIGYKPNTGSISDHPKGRFFPVLSLPRIWEHVMNEASLVYISSSPHQSPERQVWSSSALHESYDRYKPNPHREVDFPSSLVDGATNNGVPDVFEKKPDIVDSFVDFVNADHIETFKKYEADYVRRLNAKYFSKKNLYGGNIFDEKMTIDDETIKSSRWSCTQSYADPVQGFEDQSSSGSTSTAETPTNISNGKYPSKKSG
ncbi:hypothetical protein L1049_028020 [Liquidambar formosana]|uniref:Uncharacterized protein n=1 Tax=Liquidambar formosana TaxID=63359 RepID=A0AAP0WWA8_LIQFO